MTGTLPTGRPVPPCTPFARPVFGHPETPCGIRNRRR